MKLLKFLFLLALPLFFIACDPDDKPAAKTGDLKIQLADAPFDYGLVSQANVTVFKVEIANGEEFLTLTEEEFAVNLLELTNGVTETLVDSEIPVGEYNLIRVYVKDASVVLNDGTVYNLKVPSGEQTGIKINVDPAIRVRGGLTSELLLDFDVSKSFVARGNIGKPNFNGFIFKPTLKAVNLSTAGTLAGTVVTGETPLEGAQVSVIVADTVNTTTFTDLTGGYTILGLAEGIYGVTVELEGYEPQSVNGIDITSGNKTTQNFELIATEPVVQ